MTRLREEEEDGYSSPPSSSPLSLSLSPCYKTCTCTDGGLCNLFGYFLVNIICTSKGSQVAGRSPVLRREREWKCGAMINKKEKKTNQEMFDEVDYAALRKPASSVDTSSPSTKPKRGLLCGPNSSFYSDSRLRAEPAFSGLCLET